MKRVISLLLMGLTLFTLSACTNPLEQKETYTVIFETNGGNTIDSLSVEEGRSITEPAIPLKEGYVFTGWYSDSTFNSVYDFSKGLNGDLKLYANWNTAEFTLSFDTSGGTELDSILYEYNAAVAAVDNPVRLGSVFDGWYLDEGFTEEFSFTEMPAQDVTLYASWVVNKNTIAFDPNGGSIVDSITQDFNSVVTMPSDPIREGYSFDGWYLDASPYVFETMPEPGIELTAAWAPNTYVLTFDTNEGNEISEINWEYDSNIYLPLPIRDGYIFEGWFLDEEFLLSYDAYGLHAENITLFAYWIECTNNAENGTRYELSIDQKTTINVWLDNGNYAATLVEEFEALYPDINVEYKIGSSVYNMGNMFLYDETSHQADVFVFPHNDIITALDYNLLYPFPDSQKEDLVDRMVDTSINTATACYDHITNVVVECDGVYESELFAAPISGETVALFYNKTLLDSIDNTKTYPEATWEEIIASALAYNDVDENKLYFSLDVDNAYDVHFIATSFGFDLFGPDHLDKNSANLDSIEMINALTWMNETLRPAMNDNTATYLSGEVNRELFEIGELPYIIDGPWSIQRYKEAAAFFGFEFGIAKIPTINGVDPTTFSGVQMAGVSKKTVEPIAAFKFVEFMTSDVGLNIMYEETNKLPVLKDISNIEGIVTDEYLSGISAQLIYSEPMPIIPEMGYFWSNAQTMYRNVWDGLATPADAAVTAQTEYETQAGIDSSPIQSNFNAPEYINPIVLNETYENTCTTSHTVFVHYHRWDYDYSENTIWSWGYGTEGSGEGTGIVGEDNFGGVFQICVDETDADDELGLIMKYSAAWSEGFTDRDAVDTNNDGSKDGEHKLIPIRDEYELMSGFDNNNVKHVYVFEGSNQVIEADDPNSLPYSNDLATIAVIYYDQAQDYEDWNIWTWGTGTNGTRVGVGYYDNSGVPFVSQLGKDGGIIENLRVAFINVDPSDMDNEIGFIVRTDAWERKTDTDIFIHVDGIAAGDFEMVFYIAGDNFIYDDFNVFMDMIETVSVVDVMQLDTTSIIFTLSTNVITDGTENAFDLSLFSVYDKNGNEVSIKQINYNILTDSNKTFVIVFENPLFGFLNNYMLKYGANDIAIFTVDEEPPEIHIIGATYVELLLGDTYQLPEIIATDWGYYGNIEIYDIYILEGYNIVDTTIAGIYEVVIIATDNFGNSIEAIITVVVIDPCEQ